MRNKAKNEIMDLMLLIDSFLYQDYHRTSLKLNVATLNKCIQFLKS